jgi:hypothetical protein
MDITDILITGGALALCIMVLFAKRNKTSRNGDSGIDADCGGSD